MKVAIISITAGTLLNFRGPLIAEMVRLGHQVLAFAPDHDEATRSALRKLGAQPIDFSMSRTGTNPLRELLTIADLWRRLRSHRPDLCFSYIIKPAIYGTIAAWLAGVRRRHAMIEGLGYAFTEADNDSPRRALLQSVISALMRFAMRRADSVVFLNEDDRALFLNRRLLAAPKARLLGGIGVDLTEWASTPSPTGLTTFLLAARIVRDKGITEYVDAARLCQRSGIAARFILLGGLDSNPAAITRSEVEAWVAERIIEWPGHVDVKPWLAAAHVFVLPSYYREGVPRSTQEAMAMGRAIITTDSTGCRDTVIDGENGFLVPVRDPVALAAAMRRFIEDPSLLEPMGRASRRLAEERFDVHVQNRKLLDFMGL